MTYTLENALMAQGDLGTRSIAIINKAVLNGDYQHGKDPIVDIIVDAHMSNMPSDIGGMISDISYAISELSRVKKYLESLG